ncbi:unnamed protein product [Ranitomeya imitator]|uniref:Reverse transcriptase domain-containing protein n=1 Tax=Ranitomeya imitator TaxID=111125 RepID=A0ABN9M4R6_9NEOB|nr:unnamed protein product [Ranitomeya imitator]
MSISNLGLRSPSNFHTPRSFNATEAFIDLVHRDISQILDQHHKGLLPTRSNITSIEKQAIESLTNNKHIVIKHADKGFAIVIQDSTDYTNEILRQLSDTTTYQPIPHDPVLLIRSKIQHVLTKHLVLNTIDSKTSTFLMNQNPVTPVFYTLPKVHKSLINPPGRPIVASTDSILAPISIFHEKILTPLTKKTQSFILDTGHFLHSISQFTNISSDCFLVTFDVKSLYTSIEHDLGITAVRKLLQSSNLNTNSTQLCLDLLSIVLRENYFLFGDQFYSQICGTAMGANVAPAYANAYLDDFEQSHVYSNTLFQQYSKCWFRFIDDIFCLWMGLIVLHGFPHLYQTTITIHTELAMAQISFLDTLVIKNEKGTLSTDIFTKPTDTNNLLHFTSCHPSFTENSLPCSQFTRITRIVSDTDLIPICLEEMADKFKNRQYPQQLLLRESARAVEPRSTPPTLPTKERVTFVHTHHPVMPKIYNVIHKHRSLLTKSYPNIEAFHTPALMCKRRPKNIRDSLVRADIGSFSRVSKRTFLGTERKGTFPCLNCACCSNVIKGSEITHPHTGKRYNINGFYTCDTNYVVYLIKCPAAYCMWVKPPSTYVTGSLVIIPRYAVRNRGSRSLTTSPILTTVFRN